jgi:hypothetical protein
MKNLRRKRIFLGRETTKLRRKIIFLRKEMAKLPKETGKNGQIPGQMIKNVKISLKPATVFRHVSYIYMQKCRRLILNSSSSSPWSEFFAQQRARVRILPTIISRFEPLNRAQRSAAVPGGEFGRRLAASFNRWAGRPANPPAGRRRYEVHGEVRTFRFHRS